MRRAGLMVIAIATFADAAPSPGPVPEKCRNPPTLERGGIGLGAGGGGSIDACRSSHGAMPLPKTVTLAIAPDPVIVRAGHEGSALLVIENGSDGDAELFLDDEHVRLTSPKYEIDSGSGKRVDISGDECAELVAMMPRTLHISLSAHKYTTVPFDVRTIVSRYDGSCTPTDGKPLRAGRYVLVVHAPEGDVRGRLVVR